MGTYFLAWIKEEQRPTKRIVLLLPALNPQAPHPAGGDGVLEHAADSRGQSPRLPPQQALHTALGGQQGEVRQPPVAMETEQLVAMDGNIQYVCKNGAKFKKNKIK